MGDQRPVPERDVGGHPAGHGRRAGGRRQAGRHALHEVEHGLPRYSVSVM